MARVDHQRAIRRDSFQSVPDLVREIEQFVADYNLHPQPLHVDRHRRFDPRQARTT
jgi:hypothetical protein